MIKNYEDFVNEGFRGFLDSVITGIETGVSGYKTVRKASAAVESEAERILKSGDEVVSEETQLSVLMKKLIVRVASLVDNFSSVEDNTNYYYYITQLEKIEELISRSKELLKEGTEDDVPTIELEDDDVK
jgi:hypothetical protein